MDKILLGIAASTHSEAVKRAIIDRIINSASKAPPEDLVIAILDISSRWVTESDSDFMQQMGRQLFHAWAKHNQTIFEEFFNHQFLVGILRMDIPHPDRTVCFVHECLKMLQNRATAAKIIQMQAVALIRKHRDLLTLVEVSHLLLAFPDCLPKGTAAASLCIAAVENVSALQVAPSEAAMKANLEGMIHISAMLHHIWHDNMVTVLPSLAAVFNLISALPSSDRPNPSVALGALVQHVPVELIATVTKNAASDVSIVDERMTTALSRMIDWLSWPRILNIDRWIVSFLKNLALAQKFTMLINVTLASIEKVFVKLCFPIVRDSALPVLTHMQLSFQHSPEAFHKIVAHVPELMKRLKSENTPSSQDCSQKVAELVYCLMYHHAGYPDLYEPVLDALKDIPRPSEEAMRETLKLSAWTSGAPVNSAFSTRFLLRSETGKTGLVNLGNTCYMNSVLQALLMTSGFYEDIMACPVYNDQCVVARLQTVFAFLTHTQRAAYSPREFLIASRPPWFSPGTQQDCSEFLKYLLDRLDEEEKSIRKFEAQLQRTREWVEHMKRKNAKKLGRETGRIASEEEGDEGGPQIGDQKGIDICSRLDVDSSIKMDTSSNEIANKEEVRPIEQKEKNEQNRKIASGEQTQNERCNEVTMETSVSSPTRNTLTVSLSEVTRSEQGHPICFPTAQDNSAVTELMTVSGFNMQCDQASSNVKIKLPVTETKKTMPESPIGPSIVEQYFSGKSVTRIRCLTCNSISSRTEAFFDLPLAFPGSDTTSSMRGGESCTSKDEAGKSLGLAADRLAQEEITSGSKQWELNGGAAASTSAIKDFVTSPGQSGEGRDSSDASPSSLEELLVHYLTPELLTGDNQYHCGKCQCLRDAEKRIEISKAPKVLMLTLMRFSYDVKTQSRCKILADVWFPKILDLALHHPEREAGGDTEEDKPDEQDLCQDPPRSKRLRQNSENVAASESNRELKYRQVPWESEEWSGCQTANEKPRHDLHVREMALKKNLQEAVTKDNAIYLKERELEARMMALRTSQGLESFSSNQRDFDDRNDPPSGCGGGGGGMEPPRLVF
ncbi:ubiquitin carboxyl-terminal hydrolase 38-like isoform X2 [Acanthaster planci]|uniref:Ubiquitin carboxyl-terminal hydrolase 38-like isoform X2 n=1 Tax=Acanthaster planci TaxID=133434 RepID=A0A8B7Z022_ACAPL|nr:ubiquitin carboxyl-terminal hydrolase 38-like isoform X2 [Acanthaster planci]